MRLRANYVLLPLSIAALLFLTDATSAQESAKDNHQGISVSVEMSQLTDIVLNPKRTAIIIVDMWRYKTEPYQTLARQLDERMVPVIQSARSKGVTIIHAPGGFEVDRQPQASYLRSMIKTKPELTTASDTWPSPDYVVFYGCEYCTVRELEVNPRCASPMHAGPDASYEPWLREDESLEKELDKHPEDWFIDGRDAGGKRLTAFLHQRRINTIVFVGAATDQCVLTRPYGVRQMTTNKFRCVVVKDLTSVSFCNRPNGKEIMEEAQKRALAYLETVQRAYLIDSDRLKKAFAH